MAKSPAIRHLIRIAARRKWETRARQAQWPIGIGDGDERVAAAITCRIGKMG
jgi:hypothetical protein